MKLVAFGVNHKTAPVALRERLAFADDLPNALAELKQITAGAFILSTCNRSEIYAYLPQDDALHRDQEYQDQAFQDQDDELAVPILAEWLGRFKGISPSQIHPYSYCYESNLALTHWLRVAVGLDSMILGEPQILGQLRQAVAAAQQAGTLAPEFDWLTQRVFKAARIVRRDTTLGKQAVTLGFATAKLVTQIFDKPSDTTLLVVAAGEMNRLVAQNVADLGIKTIIICNRNPQRAQALANELMAGQSNRQVICVDFDKLSWALTQADIVSSCSGSMHTLIDKAMAKHAIKARKYRPMLMVDLAVPRDIAPEVGKIDGVYLYSIDDLGQVIAGNLAQRKQAAIEAELLVGQLASRIETERHIKAIGSTISAYHQLLAQQKNALLTTAHHRLAKGDNPKEVLDKFAHQLTQTLIHPSLKALRFSANALDEETLDKLNDELLGAYRHSIPKK